MKHAIFTYFVTSLVILAAARVAASDQLDPLVVGVPDWKQVSTNPASYTFNGRPFAVGIMDTCPDVPGLRQSIAERLQAIGKLDQVLFHGTPGMKSPSHACICIGSRVPREIAQAVMAGCLPAMKDGLVITRGDGEIVNQEVEIGFLPFGPTLSGDKAIAALLDAGITDAQFAALLPRTPAAPAYSEPHAKGLIASYAFDDSDAEASGHGPSIIRHGAVFSDHALALHRNYEDGLDPDNAYAFSAMAPVRGLNCNDFTVSIEFKADAFQHAGGDGKDAIVLLGPLTRWFAVYRGGDGALILGFNNGAHLLRCADAVVSPHEWHALTCGVDLKRRSASVWLDGSARTAITIPGDLEFGFLQSDDRGEEQAVIFEDTGLGIAFHGLVDNLAIFNGQISEDAAREIHAKARFIADKATSRGH